MSIRKICLDFHTHTLILYFTIYKDISEILTTRYEVGFFPPIIYICGSLSWRFIQKTDHVRIQSWSAKPSKIHTTRSSRRMSTVKFRYSETKSNSLGAIIAITGSTYKYTYVLQFGVRRTRTTMENTVCRGTRPQNKVYYTYVSTSSSVHCVCVCVCMRIYTHVQANGSF